MNQDDECYFAEHPERYKTSLYSNFIICFIYLKNAHGWG